MPSSARGPSPVEMAANDIALLSATLSDSSRLGSRDKIKIARRIGFAIGVDLLCRGHFKESNIESGIRSLFNRLQLRPPILRSWGPVVFVRHSVPPMIQDENQKIKQLEAAFGEGVVEGLAIGREDGRIFLRHSIAMPQLSQLSQNSTAATTRSKKH